MSNIFYYCINNGFFLILKIHKIFTNQKRGDSFNINITL